MIGARLVDNEQRILDFDIETLAAGYADPSWVPDKITCAAWGWVGEKKIEVACDPYGYFDRDRRREIIRPLLEAISAADIVQGHNIIRFDLRVIQAEAMRLKLPLLGKLRVIDTMRLPKAKGYKKSQDDMAVDLGVSEKKQKMNWQEWDDAYEEGPPWTTVKARAVSDVRQNKALAVEMEKFGWLKGPVIWRP
jgi:DNA polymerase elongation subunit (family B)